MRIHVQNGVTFELEVRDIDLREAFPEDDEYEAALAELLKTGRYWYGGGAVPLVYLTRA